MKTNCTETLMSNFIERTLQNCPLPWHIEIEGRTAFIVCGELKLIECVDCAQAEVYLHYAESLMEFALPPEDVRFDLQISHQHERLESTDFDEWPLKKVA